MLRWPAGLDWDDRVFDHSVLSDNRSRLLAGGAVHALLGEAESLAQRTPLTRR